MTPLPRCRRPPARWAAPAVLALHALVAAALWQGLQVASGAASPSQPAVTWVRRVEVVAPPVGGPPLHAPAPAALRPPAVPWIDAPVVDVDTPPRRSATPAEAAPAPVATARASPPAPEHTLVAAAPARPPAPPAAQRNPPVIPVRQGADHRDCVRAPYPAALRDRGIEGQLRLRVHVTPEGRAAEVRLVASSGWRLFDEAALAQVRGCRFEPAREDGQAVADWVEFPVRFALDG